jgi:hypothetical protein
LRRHRARSQESEFRRKTIKIEFLTSTDYWLLDSLIADRELFLGIDLFVESNLLFKG